MMKRIYLVEHQSGLDANQKRQRVAQDAGGWIQHPDQEHLLGSKRTRTNYGVWNEQGFWIAHRLTA